MHTSTSINFIRAVTPWQRRHATTVSSRSQHTTRASLPRVQSLRCSKKQPTTYRRCERILKILEQKFATIDAARILMRPCMPPAAVCFAVTTSNKHAIPLLHKSVLILLLAHAIVAHLSRINMFTAGIPCITIHTRSIPSPCTRSARALQRTCRNRHRDTPSGRVYLFCV